MVRGARAIHDGTSATEALIRADAKLRELQLGQARDDLLDARRRFATAQDRIDTPGPLLLLARVTPLVRKQLEGAEVFARTGERVAAAAAHVAGAGDDVLRGAQTGGARPRALRSRTALGQLLQPGFAAIVKASEDLASLNGTRLLGPIGEARADLVRHLPRAADRLRDVRDRLVAFAAFTGHFGPRRYLFFSQNPAEPRPTGGYMGTYGVIRASQGVMAIERYEGTDRWHARHPGAAVAPDRAPAPFPFLEPPKRQSIANLNAVADWPQVSRAVLRMWRRGGERRVDGVLSASTGFLARVLRVLGPARVPGYDEVVTADTVVARMDYFSRRVAPDRKEFVAAVARGVLERLVSAPASRMPQLARAVARAFEGREAMAWTTDEGVNAALARRGWDGAMRRVRGDFFRDAPFSFAAKNGRGLRRDYDHRVALAADGSARVRTLITLRNTEPVSPLNPDGLAYITIFGPRGARLDPGITHRPATRPPVLAGHPAAGWFRAPAPGGGRASIKVGWRVPSLWHRREDGRWAYRLTWQRVPDHGGDVVRLAVALPPGWRWSGAPPPRRIRLDADVSRTWLAVPPPD